MIKNITTEIFSNLTNSCGTSRASWSWGRVSTQRTSLFPTQHWIWRRKYRSAWLNWIWLSKLEVPYAAPIWHLLLVPLPLFRNQNMPCTQRIPSNLPPSHTREQFREKTKGTGAVPHGIESSGVLHTRLHPHRQLCGHAPPPLPHHHHP